LNNLFTLISVSQIFQNDLEPRKCNLLKVEYDLKVGKLNYLMLDSLIENLVPKLKNTSTTGKHSKCLSGLMIKGDYFHNSLFYYH
jgi:hypothetical protein